MQRAKLESCRRCLCLLLLLLLPAHAAAVGGSGGGYGEYTLFVYFTCLGIESCGGLVG